MFSILADTVVVIHFAFILFVMFGALLNIWWQKIVWIHLPALVWGSLIELFSLICPLTPLENYFRQLAGTNDYSGGFIENYLVPLIYPADLTPEVQWVLGIALIIFNLFIYAYLWRRSHNH
jgi:hypothetical protein